ncbi:MAG: hypothetical protein L0Z50_09345 [Verrucomicrobiales bacterium]|nr:hypothetical protein [Verrucomicrobiales bacterium]
MTHPTFADEAIAKEEWQWVRELIQDVDQDTRRDQFVRSFFHWDLAVHQFRKVEQKRVISQTPSETDLRNHALCLHALLTIGHALVFESKKFQAEQLGQFGVKHSDIDAYVDELEQSLREWHHGFSGDDIVEAQQKIFGASA